MTPILSLNARSYVLFECIKDSFDLDTKGLRKEITILHSETINTLKSKGIDYMALKSALTPKTDKYEAAFLFDTRKIESGWYGLSVFRAFIHLLNKSTTQSVRVGDLLGENQKLIFEILDSSLVKHRELNFVHSSNFYCIYINNLSEHRINEIHKNLMEFNAYCGYIPATKEIVARIYLSTTLMSFFLKHKNKIITSHEIDRLDRENRHP